MGLPEQWTPDSFCGSRPNGQPCAWAGGDALGGPGFGPFTIDLFENTGFAEVGIDNVGFLFITPGGNNPFHLKVVPTVPAEPERGRHRDVQRAGLRDRVPGRRNGMNLSDGGSIIDANTTNLTMTNVTAANAGNYDGVLTSPCGTVNTVSVCSRSRAEHPARADFNTDGVVDLADLLDFLGQWNPNLGQNVPAGTNGDTNGTASSIWPTCSTSWATGTQTRTDLPVSRPRKDFTSPKPTQQLPAPEVRGFSCGPDAEPDPIRTLRPMTSRIAHVHAGSADFPSASSTLPEMSASSRPGGRAFTAGQICEAVGGELRGNPNVRIERVSAIDDARDGPVTLVRSSKYAQRWSKSAASAVLISRNIPLPPTPGDDDRAIIVVPDADEAMIKVLTLFEPPSHAPEPGIHPTAVVDPSAVVPPTCRIGPNSVVGPRTRLGEHTVLHANAVAADVEIGPASVLFPGVVIYDRRSARPSRTPTWRRAQTASAIDRFRRKRGSSRSRTSERRDRQHGRDRLCTCIDRGVRRHEHGTAPKSTTWFRSTQPQDRRAASSVARGLAARDHRDARPSRGRWASPIT